MKTDESKPRNVVNNERSGSNINRIYRYPSRFRNFIYNYLIFDYLLKIKFFHIDNFFYEHPFEIQWELNRQHHTDFQAIFLFWPRVEPQHHEIREVTHWAIPISFALASNNSVRWNVLRQPNSNWDIRHNFDDYLCNIAWEKPFAYKEKIVVRRGHNPLWVVWVNLKSS